MLFELHDLTKRYDGADALYLPALALAEGRVYGLIGPNGAGKTTLLEILAGIIPATTGTVRFKGDPIDSTESSLAVRRRLTYLAQNPILFRGSAVENVEYGLKVRGVSKPQRMERAMRALAEVGLAHLASRDAHTLSAGERQRVAFARAIAIEPEAVLLDEPTANVDQESTDILYALIRRLNAERGVGIVFTSHEIAETVSLADEIIALNKGRLVPSPVANIFSGIIEHDGNHDFVRVTDAIRIEAVTEKTGRAKITINPQGIVISREPLSSSARNTFKAVITHIEEEGHLARVTMDCGIPLVAHITQASRQEMSLIPGMHVHLSFKSTSVAVY